jgi:general secretion pathway protein K
MRVRKSRGIALITALWVLAVLLVLLGGFAAMVHSEVQVARNFGQLMQARWAARAGMRRAEVEIARIAAEPYTALDGSSCWLTAEDEEIELGDASYQVEIVDEAGKVNINTAPAIVLQVLFPPEIADAILDWRDADSTPEMQGAEEDYYAGLTSPYHCKNGPFTTVRELLLVKGVTREMLAETVTQDGRTLESLLTVWSWDTNVDAEGNPRLNIATADKVTLLQTFGETLTEQEVDAIIAQRTASAFSSPADLLRVPDLAREKVAQIYDRVTANAQNRREGLVNVNTAPLEVLLALSGMDEATAGAIVQHRDTHGPFTDLGQLLAVELVGTAAFVQASEYLTTRSTVFSVHATGQFADGVGHTTTGVVQAEEMTGNMATRVLYWHE